MKNTLSTVPGPNKEYSTVPVPVQYSIICVLLTRTDIIVSTVLLFAQYWKSLATAFLKKSCFLHVMDPLNPHDFPIARPQPIFRKKARSVFSGHEFKPPCLAGDPPS